MFSVMAGRDHRKVANNRVPPCLQGHRVGLYCGQPRFTRGDSEPHHQRGAKRPLVKKTATARKVATPKTAAAPRAPRATAASKSAAPKSTRLPPEVAALRKQVITALEDLKAKDIKEIDVRGKASFADMLVIASGTSTRHVKSMADEVVRFAKRAGVLPLGVEGQSEAEWVLVDLGDIVVHVMLPRIREFYGLERLWTVGDSPHAANDLD